MGSHPNLLQHQSYKNTLIQAMMITIGWCVMFNANRYLTYRLRSIRNYCTTKPIKYTDFFIFNNLQVIALSISLWSTRRIIKFSLINFSLIYQEKNKIYI